MNTFFYYATWFLRYFIVYLVIHLIGSGFLVRALPRINYGVFLLMFILFDVVLIIQAMFIQIFFTRSKIGILIALLFYVLQYVISYMVTTNPYATLEINQLASIVPHVAFILSMKTLVFADSVRANLTFTE